MSTLLHTQWRFQTIKMFFGQNFVRYLVIFLKAVLVEKFYGVDSTFHKTHTFIYNQSLESTNIIHKQQAE